MACSSTRHVHCCPQRCAVKTQEGTACELKGEASKSSSSIFKLQPRRPRRGPAPEEPVPLKKKEQALFQFGLPHDWTEH